MTIFSPAALYILSSSLLVADGVLFTGLSIDASLSTSPHELSHFLAVMRAQPTEMTLSLCFYSSQPGAVIIDPEMQSVLHGNKVDMLVNDPIGGFCGISEFFTSYSTTASSTSNWYMHVDLTSFRNDAHVWKYALSYPIDLFDSENLGSVLCFSHRVDWSPVVYDTSPYAASSVSYSPGNRPGVNTCDIGRWVLFGKPIARRIFQYYKNLRDGNKRGNWRRHFPVFILSTLMASKDDDVVQHQNHQHHRPFAVVDVQQFVFTSSFGLKTASIEEQRQAEVIASLFGTQSIGTGGSGGGGDGDPPNKSSSHDDESLPSDVLFEWNVPEPIHEPGSACVIHYPANYSEVVVTSDDILRVILEIFVDPDKLADPRVEQYSFVITPSCEYEARIIQFEPFNVGSRTLVNNMAQVGLSVSLTMRAELKLAKMWTFQVRVEGILELESPTNADTTHSTSKMLYVCDAFSYFAVVAPPLYPPTVQEPPSLAALMSNQYRDLFGNILLHSLRLDGGATVEIGVYRGVNSESFLSNWPEGGQHLVVDPWIYSEEYFDKTNKDYATNPVYSEAIDRLGRFNGRVKVLRSGSIEAAQLVSPHSVSYVYIDARHDYYNVMKDMRTWWSKLRVGGVLAGHDYDMLGVAGAVDEFAIKMGRKVFFTNNLEIVTQNQLKFKNVLPEIEEGFIPALGENGEFVYVQDTYTSWFMVK